MLELLKYIIIGSVQGLAEFLPISSSGHLILFGKILGISGTDMTLEILVHFGTLVAIFFAYKKDILELIKVTPKLPSYLTNKASLSLEEKTNIQLIINIVLATIPAVIIGLSFKDSLEHNRSNLMVALALLFTSGFLFSIKFLKDSNESITLKKAILIGFAQAFAIIPGISRSGATICMALWLGIDREKSARFSFLMSIPVILGATILKLKEMFDQEISTHQLLLYLVATATAAITGYLSILFIKYLIKQNRFHYFAIYCAIVGTITLIFFRNS